jgi:hypothetical protein
MALRVLEGVPGAAAPLLRRLEGGGRTGAVVVWRVNLDVVTPANDAPLPGTARQEPRHQTSRGEATHAPQDRGKEKPSPVRAPARTPGTPLPLSALGPEVWRGLLPPRRTHPTTEQQNARRGPIGETIGKCNFA